MATTQPRPTEGPTLIAYVPAARERLEGFYAPHAAAMSIHESLARVLLDPQKLQRRYETLASPSSPEGLLAARYSPFYHIGSWYPEPADYLRVHALMDKFEQLLSETEARKAVRRVCQKRYYPPGRVTSEEDREEVTRATVLRLLASHRLPAAERNARNDYVSFLTAWKDTHSLPEAAQPLARQRLIERPIDNTVKRLLRDEKRNGRTAGNDDLEFWAEAGERIEVSHSGSVQNFVAQCTELTDVERRVLVFRYDYGCTYEEIGLQIGCSTSTAHKHQYRAIRKLRGE
jgi:RNA polymerase sigma factor (sigma-70 family)